MRYHYRAVNEQGQIHNGQLDASNLSDLELRLNRIGLTLIRAKARQGERLGRRRIVRRDLITFCFHLEQLAHAGVPLIEGLVDLRDSTDHPRFREVIANLIEDIEGGKQFSQALSEHPAIFDDIFVNLVRAGEISGELPEVLKRLSDALKWQDELAAQTRKIVMYPAFVGLLVFGVAIFLMIYLVPQLVSFIKDMGQTLPLNTRILLAISDFLVNYWWALIVAPLLTWGFIHYRLKTSPSFRLRVDGWKIRFPVIGPILHKIILARFASFFAMLYASGIPILDCLRVMERIVGNTAVADALSHLDRRIREGQGVSTSFGEVGLFPPLVLRMLRIGETTGALDTALLNVSYFYDRDVKESIGRVQTLIEPALTVVLGLILAWIMWSVLGPIFDTISQIR